jgi:hypothetical protein
VCKPLVCIKRFTFSGRWGVKKLGKSRVPEAVFDEEEVHLPNQPDKNNYFFR